MTLKILCGFSLSEVARGLLISAEAAKKRVQRAKKTLALRQIRVDLPPAAELKTRLSAVQEVLYLLFNEGYSTSQGHRPLRDDICEEAARLCHLLCEHETFSTPDTRALLALMLAHAARLEARVDPKGAVVLLAEQDRSKWDINLIRIAELWLKRSKTKSPSRFHLEAAIALVHCRATSVSETNWHLIVRFYDRLLALHDSPLYILNRAIARGESGDLDVALAELESIRNHRAMRNYFLLDCAVGRLHELGSNSAAALEAYAAARSAAVAPHERAVLDKKLAQLG
jgi:RNA polymerase sigma-70 factor (ECF subfamily)